MTVTIVIRLPEMCSSVLLSSLIILLVSPIHKSSNEGREFLFPVPAISDNITSVNAFIYVTCMWYRGLKLQVKVIIPTPTGESTETVMRHDLMPKEEVRIPYPKKFDKKVEWNWVPTIWIQADGNVSVVTSISSNECDGVVFLVHATSSWGTSYYVTTVENKPMITITSLKDTTVSITISIKNFEGYNPSKAEFKPKDDDEGGTYAHGATFTKSIPAMWTFQMADTQRILPLSWAGTKIISARNTPIGVISGNSILAPTKGYIRTLDNLFPLKMAGKKFIISSTPTYPRGNVNYILIIATVSTPTNIAVQDFDGEFTGHRLTYAGEVHEKVVECCKFPSNQVVRINSSRNIMVSHYDIRKPTQYPTCEKTFASGVMIVPTFLFRSNYIIKQPDGGSSRAFKYNFIWLTHETKITFSMTPVFDEEFTNKEEIHSTKLNVRVTQYNNNIKAGQDFTRTYRIWSQACNVKFGAYYAGGMHLKTQVYYSLGFDYVHPNRECRRSRSHVPLGDRVDNDCDGRVDEEATTDSDSDHDGKKGEDVCVPYGTNGSWGRWSGWGDCDLNQCVRRREMRCDNPYPGYSGVTCRPDLRGSDKLFETQSLDESGQCPLDAKCPSDCGHNRWTTSCINCSSTCDGCDPFSGECLKCAPGVFADEMKICNMECPKNRYGHNCTFYYCMDCEGACNPDTGVCETKEETEKSEEKPKQSGIPFPIKFLVVVLLIVSLSTLVAGLYLFRFQEELPQYVEQEEEEDYGAASKEKSGSFSDELELSEIGTELTGTTWTTESSL